MKTGLRLMAVVSLAVGAFMPGATAGSITITIDSVTVALTSAPEIPGAHEAARYTVRLIDSVGQPVGGAQVTLTGRMADGMTTAGALRAGDEPGVYRGDILYTMAGVWDLKLRVVHRDRRLEIPLREDVRRSR